MKCSHVVIICVIEKVGIRMMDDKKIMTYDYEFSRHCPSK